MTLKAIEALVSIIFFSNKVGMLVGKKLGWILGAIGALLSIVYFYFLDLRVYMVAELGLFVTMMYGVLVKEENRKIEAGILSSLFVIILVLTVFTFMGELTFFEFWSSAGMLAATYLLHPKNGAWKIKWGWTILAATHLGAAYIGYAKNQPMFPHYQIASAIVGVFGAIKKN